MSTKPPEDRFWAKVDKRGSCWVWMAGRLPKGYGTFFPGDGVRHALAHRWLFEHLHGPLAREVVVMHKCDNPACVNPAHLTTGSQKDNLLDASAKGRLGGRRHAPQLGESNPCAKLTDESVMAMRSERRSGMSYARLAARYGVTAMTAYDACLGRTWAHVLENQHGI